MKFAASKRANRPVRLLVWLFVIGLLLAILNLMPGVSGVRMGDLSLTLSDDTVTSEAVYKFNFTTVTPGTVGSIRLRFCAEDPLVASPCTPPGGLSVNSAVLDQQSPAEGFSISPASGNNELILTRTPSALPSTPLEFVFSGVTNPSSSGSYYVRLQTFASNDATGNFSDYGGIAFAIVNGVGITATVPPYLTFCTGTSIPDYNCASATGDFIDFGELSTSAARSGSSQMLVATNAELGYNVTLAGSTMASGSNVINAITTADVSRPGTSQFGMNLRSNVAPRVGTDPDGPGLATPTAAYNTPDRYQFNNGDIVIAWPTTDDVRRFTASYIVNVPVGQAAGVYVSTITYICLANF